MMDLEDRLRGTFTGMADEVAASTNPRADLEQRLATRRVNRWRTPALVAAAAVVVAAVVTPVVVFGGDGTNPSVDSAATTTDSTVTDPDQSREGQAPNDQYPGMVAGPFELGTFTRDGLTWRAEAYLEESAVCVVATSGEDLFNPSPECTPVSAWPRPPANSLVMSLAVLSEGAPDTGPLPNLLLFVTAPEVATLDVRDGPGDAVSVRELGASDKATLWLADFGGPTEGFGYTAKDAAGTVLEEAIT